MPRPCAITNCVVNDDALMGADLPEWWGARHSERMGNTPSSTVASPPDHQGRLHGHRHPSSSPRPTGQTAWLRRPPRLPARPARRRLERPSARHPPGHHPAGHPPRDPGLSRPAASPPRAAGPSAPACRPATRRRPRRRARLCRGAGLPGGPAGHQGVDTGGGGGRAWRRARHPAAPTGPLPGPAGGADPAAARRGRGCQRTQAAGGRVRARRARLAELGFTEVDDYLRDRFVGRGWSVRRLGAELGVGHGWLDQQLTRLGLRS
jgi:hypothetical protein